MTIDLDAVDLQNERAVLGGAMHPEGGRETLNLLAAAVRPADFVADAHQVIFGRMLELRRAGHVVDHITIVSALRAHGERDGVGGESKSAQLYNAGLFALPVHTPTYIAQLLERSRKGVLRDLGERVARAASNGSSSADVLDEITRTVDSLRSHAARQRPDEAPSELTALLAHRFPPRADVIGRGLLPRGGLLLFGGAPKTGKSLALDNLSLQRARGRAWLGFPTDPGVTLVVQSELRAIAVADRFRIMLKDDPDPIPEGRLHVKTRRGVMLDEPAGLAQIGAWIEETGADVLRIDPLARHVGGDENSNKDMGTVVRAIDSLIERYGVSVIIAHHPSKPTKDDARTGGHRLRGASALFGAADSVIMMDKADDGFTLSFDLRHGPAPDVMRITRTEDLWFVPAGPDPELLALAALVAPTPLPYNVLVSAAHEDLKLSKTTAKRRAAAALAAGVLAKDLDGLYHPGAVYHAVSRSHEVSPDA